MGALILAATGQEEYQQIDDSHMVDMLARIDFRTYDLDQEVLDGESLGDIYATLERDTLEGHVERLGEGLGQVLEAVDFEGDPGTSRTSPWAPSTRSMITKSGTWTHSIEYTLPTPLVGTTS